MACAMVVILASLFCQLPSSDYCLVVRGSPVCFMPSLCFFPSFSVADGAIVVVFHGDNKRASSILKDIREKWVAGR